jgi:hypothetical protein
VLNVFSEVGVTPEQTPRLGVLGVPAVNVFSEVGVLRTNVIVSASSASRP